MEFGLTSSAITLIIIIGMGIVKLLMLNPSAQSTESETSILAHVFGFIGGIIISVFYLWYIQFTKKNNKIQILNDIKT